MKLNLFLILIVIITVLSCNNKSDRKNADNIRIGQSIDSIFNQLATDEIFNGEILVAQENEIIIQKYYGNADLTSNENFTDESVFEIASVSKPFTAFAIKLVSERKLSYESHNCSWAKSLGNIKKYIFISVAFCLVKYKLIINNK